MNRITVTLLCLMLCLAGTTVPTDTKVSAADTVANRVIAMTIGSKILKIDDVDDEIDAGPQIKWGRTFSPIAPIINTLGGTTQWNARTRKVTIDLDTKTIVLTIGSRYAVVNGKRVFIDSNPDLVPYVQAPGRTMLPVRFIAEQFGALVTWNSTLQRVTLTLKVTSPPLPLTLKVTSPPLPPALKVTSPPLPPALKVTSPPLPLTQRVISFTPSQTSSTFLALLGDESIDVIELNGTYSFAAPIYIDIERTRPVVVRPAAGATVVFSGAKILGGAGQFEIGDHGRAGNITMQGFTFDGFILQQIGIIHIFNAHDITLNDMVVRNSGANGTTAAPYHSWAVYITSTATVIPTNITVNRWTIDGSARGMSALQVYGGSHITATGWSVAHAYFAIYACSDRGPLTDFVLSNWTISDTSSSGNASVYFKSSSGTYSNLHATGSGALANSGTPNLIDGGGNSL